MFIVGALAPAQGATLIEGVSFAARSDGGGYVMRIETTGVVNAFQTPQRIDPAQISFVLYNVGLGEDIRRAPPAGPVIDYELVAEKGHVRIRLALDPNARVSVEAYRDRASTDILVNLSYASPVRLVSNIEPAPPVDRASRWVLDTIVIDAGHGGHDTGTSHHGVDEKDLVLDVTMRVGALLDKFMPAVDIVYTRTDDTFISLHERGHIANKAGAKLFVSIHANAAYNSSAHGTETYFLGLHKSESARRVMERENQVVQLEDNPGHYDEFDQQELILQTLAQSSYLRKSQQLAGIVQKAFTEEVGRHNRGVKQAGFLVLWAASMPAILVELGFVSNSQEARYLSSESGKSEMASAIFRAIRDFKIQYDNDLNSDTARRN